MTSPARRHLHAEGTGPGPITPDGCAVELYSLLPAGDTPAVIHSAIPAGASILELGAGAGRLTHPLLDLGHHVVAVDESSDMLARIQGAETVCSTIEELRLDRAFDAVLLASHLVNVPADDVRTALLATCRRHVRDDGVVLVERTDRAWADTVHDRASEKDGVRSELHVIDRPGPGLLTATVDYSVGERRWTHTFTMRGLDDDELAACLSATGLQLDRILTDDRKWVSACPDPT